MPDKKKQVATPSTPKDKSPFSMFSRVKQLKNVAAKRKAALDELDTVMGLPKKKKKQQVAVPGK